jgi:hypothetical protein
MESPQRSRTLRPFVERCCLLRVYVLPAEVLNATPLPGELVTGEVSTSLHDLASAEGLCFVQVEYSFAPGQYWTRAAATPELSNAEHVVLTEEHLCYALPWDVRLQGKCPSHIRRIIFACAQEAHPIPPPAERISSNDLLLDPRDDLVVAETIEVSTEDIERALTSEDQGCSRDVAAPPGSKPSGADLQQILLRMVLGELKQQLAHARRQAKVQSIWMRYNLVKRLRRWQRKTHQRIVYIARGWSEKRRSVGWILIVGMPEFLVAAA